MKKTKLLPLLALCCVGSITAQNKISIDPSTQRFLGDESEFKREKFVGFHHFQYGADKDFEKFKKDYNADPAYQGSRTFRYPASVVKNRVIPEVTKKYSGEREVIDYVATGHPGMLYPDKSKDWSLIDSKPYLTELADYVARSFRDEWDIMPRYFEPLNEPMVHAHEFTAQGGKYIREKIDVIINDINVYHRELARAIHSMPELKNMKVLGYSSAYPEFEANDFTSWDYAYKSFIDVAGKDIDIFSVHLYDGNGVNNSGGRRSGSNAEAVLDMIQTYSYIVTGEVKPIAITEYGRLVPNQPEWEAATGAKGNTYDKPVHTLISNYHPVTNSQAVRSQLHMVMSFMNRQNEITNTIPFTIGKAPQSALYCKSSMWVKQEDGSYEYSNRRYFFEMLKDIKGEQVDVKSGNIDVQALGYVDGDKLYVMLNNLSDNEETVALDLKSAGKLSDVSVKTLKIFEDKVPQLDITNMKSAPESITLQYGETAVITYDYKKDIKFKRELERVKYYSKSYLQPIESGKSITFPFEGVTAGAENVILRLGVGRDHSVKVEPTEVKVNGVAVSIEGDVIKGYDQHTRKRFFGVLEIPVPAKLLKNGKNSVSITYAEGNGHVATATLQVEQQR